MNRLSVLMLILLILFLCYSAKAERIGEYKPDTVFAFDTLNVPDSLAVVFFSGNQEVPVLNSPDSVSVKKFRGKKRLAAILAFPFPFGLLGLHRILLGTKPYIPFIYIGTLGGCFLILPVIDFIAILSADEEMFRKFENNPKVFMWSH